MTNTRVPFAAAFLIISTVIIPKAGVRFEKIPLTINLFIIGIFTLKEIFTNINNIKIKSWILLSLLLPWGFLSLNRSRNLLDSRILQFGLIYWFMLVPIFWVACDIKKDHQKMKLIPVIYTGTILTAIYGSIQLIFGLDKFSIPGITIALGDVYTTKNLTLFENGESVGTKIPSTFQGGNIWGQCSVILLVWILTTQMHTKNTKKLRLASIISLVFSIIISFSRTAVISAALTLLIYSFRNLNIKMKSICLTFFLILISINNFIVQNSRYSFESLRTSAGRTLQWSLGIQEYSFFDWLFGRSNPLPGQFVNMEGFFGMLSQIGLVGFFLLVLIWFVHFDSKFKWVGISIFICLLLDSTYISPPLLLLPGIFLLVDSKVEV